MGNSGIWEDRRPAHHDRTSEKISEHLHGYQQHIKSSNTLTVTKADERPYPLTVFYAKLGCNEICLN